MHRQRADHRLTLAGDPLVTTHTRPGPLPTDAPDTAAPDATVRALIPDHLDLAGVLGKAIEYGVVLRYANQPSPDEGEPWRLPDALTSPELEAALDAALLHPWHFDVGDDRVDTAVALEHAGTGHMGVYVTSLTREQLDCLAAAAALLDHTEATPLAERTPELVEVAEFLEVWHEADEEGFHDASLAAWRTVVRLLTLAITTMPTRAHRPRRLYGPDARLEPVVDTGGTSPAQDTALLLARIPAGHHAVAPDHEAHQPPAAAVQLDDADYRALRRLQAEWHIAIYGRSSNAPSSLLTSYAY